MDVNRCAAGEEACAPSALALVRVSFGCGFAKPPSAVRRGPTGLGAARPVALAGIVSRFASGAVHRAAAGSRRALVSDAARSARCLRA